MEISGNLSFALDTLRLRGGISPDGQVTAELGVHEVNISLEADFDVGDGQPFFYATRYTRC